MKKVKLFIFAVALLLTTLSFPALAQDDKMMKDKAMADEKPVVAIIAADWCPYCKNVDPVVKAVLKNYEGKFNVVVFDVTNEQTIAAAKEKAESLGLSDFFTANKEKTSTVAVIKSSKVLYRTTNNTKRDEYTKAFDKALSSKGK